MTLSSFKKQSKFTFIIILFGIYSALVFSLGLSVNTGYFSKVKDLFVVKKEPAQSKNTLAAPIESPLPFTDEQSGAVFGTFVKLCSNTNYSFEISYPQDWFTTYNDEKDKCTYFAPYSFTVFADPAANDVPIKIEVVQPEDWENTVKFYENPNDFQNVISSQSLELNGRSVQKIKAQTTGQVNLERGLIKISYLVFNSRLPLVLTYQQLTEKDNIADFEKNLEDMVRSLNYF